MIAPAPLRTPSGAAPVYLERCPVHARLVGFDAEHRLIGVCPDCAVEAAQAIRMVERGETAVQLLFRSEA